MPMLKKKRPSPQMVQHEAQHYRTTIIALVIFADLLKQNNPSAKFSFGRKMTTSENNLVSKNNDQTPDLVVQISDNEGYICEAKSTLSKNDENWDEHVQQLQRYDDDLKGWWTGDQKLSAPSNTVLLIDYEKSIKFKKLLETKIHNDGIILKNPIGFVGFAQESTPKESLCFSLDWGKITNRKLHSELEDRKRIPLEHFIATQDRMKFNDVQPPVEHTMEVIWTHLLNDKSTSVEFDHKSKSWPIPINVPDLTLELQKAYGQQSSCEREVCFPQMKWIRNALDHYEAIDLARKKDIDNYIVLYKHFRGDLFEKFYPARKKMEGIIERKRQGDLFVSAKNMEKKKRREKIKDKAAVSISEQKSS
jgi:hypothetical protein